MQPGSLFPALYRLKEAGWLSSDWQPSENNRRAKYYTLTQTGRKQLGEEAAQWNHIALAIARARGVAMVARLVSLWRNLVQRKRVDADLDEELRGAFDLLVAEQHDGAAEGVGLLRSCAAQDRLVSPRDHTTDE